MVVKNLVVHSKISIKAFTLIELLLSISIVAILISFSSINYLNLKKNDLSQDKKKVLEIYEIDRVINEYLLDNGNYPGTKGEIYISNNSNWIPIANLSNYISSLPFDNNNYYRYVTDGFSYEINAVLEKDLKTMQNDNGNNKDIFEIGNNLFLLN